MKKVKLRPPMKMRRELLTNIVLLILLASYYLWFADRGFAPGDEGYSLHNAERLLDGQLPYRDFFLQYPPGYFYILAICFKVLGVSVLSGRYLTLAVCLGIFIASLALLHKFGVTSWKAKVAALLCIASFGYPHINLPLVVWPSVLLTELLMIELVQFFEKGSPKPAAAIGLLLAVQFFTKQNVALVELALVNLLLWVTIREGIAYRVRSLFIMNTVWLVPTAMWLSFFFWNDLLALREFIAFNQRYIGFWPFSYPPLTFLLQPLGLFKLLPYYLPIFFLLALVYAVARGKAARKLLVLFLPLTGFFTTIYPTSDLPHVYPYFGLVLIALMMFAAVGVSNMRRPVYVLIGICIISGFYLTFAKSHYLGDPPYLQEDTPLVAPRAAGITIGKNDAQNLNAVYEFIHSHTGPHEYIFAYSFDPMLYFLLDRPNPSRYSIYYPGYLTVTEEKATVRDLQQKRVRYVIVDWQGLFNGSTPLSAWLMKKKILLHNNQYTIIDTQR